MAKSSNSRGSNKDRGRSMAFSKTIVAARKERGLTQQALATSTGVHVIQIKRYEAGNAEPSLEVLRALAVALHISADELLFDERGPDDELRLQFEAVCSFSPDEKNVAKAVLEGLILRNQAKQAAAPTTTHH